MRLIDADLLIQDTIQEYARSKQYRDAVTRMVNKAPTIEPERGEWIDMGDFEQCSACKGTHLKEFQTYYGKATWIKTDFCPNCGARMKGADDE